MTRGLSGCVWVGAGAQLSGDPLGQQRLQAGAGKHLGLP